MATQKKKKSKYKMDARYDWFGDAAESYVAYYFASEGFEVFGAGKWTADVVVRDPKRKNQWLRIEVKSTSQDRSPRHKPLAKLAKKADLLAKISLCKDTIKFTLVKLWPQKLRGESRKIPDEGNIRAFLDS